MSIPVNIYCVMWILHCAVSFGNKDTGGKRGVPCTKRLSLMSASVVIFARSLS